MNAIPRIRAGAVACLCPPDLLAVSATPRLRRIGLLGVGAAASALSQIVMFSILPLAGHALAPDGALWPVPFMTLFVGTLAATFLASVLTDALGRRTAFALGASLGVAGGLVVAWALVLGMFWPLVLGAFWIGVANGFALQYRHAAAGGDADPAAIAFVIGCGAAVGIVAPSLARFAEGELIPYLGAGSAIVAAGAHVFALGAALALPAGPQWETVPVPDKNGARVSLWLAMVSALAWFGMMAVMAFGPLGLSGCGVGFGGTVGIVSWHVVAMYAPALLLIPLIRLVEPELIAAAGLALVALGVAGVLIADVSAIAGALVAVGAGWSLATSAAMVILHRQAPTRTVIALHDSAVAVAGLAGGAASLLLL